MKIAIDLNDVIRDYTKNFGKIYAKEYGVNIEDINVTTNELDKVFHFDSAAEYKRFVYQDYPFELFGKCEGTSNLLQGIMNKWCDELKNIDSEEDIDVMIVSPMEFGLTIQGTYFFLSKIGCRIREVYFPIDSSTIWDKCDVLVTANPKLIANKPENKKVVKILTTYNKEYNVDDSYSDVCDFFADVNNVSKFLN